MAEAYLSLGSNMGDLDENLSMAEALIKERVGRIKKSSGSYKTTPWKMDSKNEFLNSVVLVETSLTPFRLLRTLQEIEREMGRTSKTHKGVYEDRIIDIDILLYDDIRVETFELTIPHPLMWQRPFVMRGLAAIDPTFIERHE